MGWVNIHLPFILMFTRVQGFDPQPLVKNEFPNWNPRKWNPGLKPEVPWWFKFDPHPYSILYLSADRKEPKSRLSQKVEVGRGPNCQSEPLMATA